MVRSVYDPETEFVLVRSETPVTVDGVAMNAPTGEVKCAECGQVAKNVDEIPHEQDCGQRFARTDWWRERFGD
jgi:hypothetical protein